MIHSVHIGDDANLIQIILGMHSPGSRVLDTTYGQGGFWERQTANPYQVMTMDRRIPDKPPGNDFFTGDWNNLPFPPQTFDALIFDPPFLVGGGDQSRIKLRYTSPANYQTLMRSIEDAGREFAKVLRPKGIIIVKAMDTIDGRRRRWLHMDIANTWTSRYYLKDLFVSVATTNIRDPGWTNQNLSRAAHCFFMVFIHRGRRKPTQWRLPWDSPTPV